MNRGNFLKSLAAIIAAPSVLKDLKPKENNIGLDEINDSKPCYTSEEILTKFNETGVLLANKRFVSAIEFLDERDINPNIYEDDSTFF